MNGNPHYDNAVYIDRDVQLRQVDALLVIAHELRTQNILTAQATPDWLNDARARMGAEPFPPGPPNPRPVPVVPADQRCGKLITEGKDAGLRCWLKTNHDGECK